MHSPIRRLLHPATSSKDEFAKLDAKAAAQSPLDHFIEAALAEGDARGLDPEYLHNALTTRHDNLWTERGKPVPYPDIDVEAARALQREATERIAEHTGHDELVLADKVCDALEATWHQTTPFFTTAERCVVADVIRQHRQG